MIKIDVTYKNFDNEQETKPLRFNLSTEEAIDLMSGENRTILDELERIGDSRDPKEIIAAFKQVLEWSYGEREGDRFVKDPERFQLWTQTLSFDAFLSQMLLDADRMAEFVNNLLPEGLQQQIAKANGGKSASQIAREASEARLQGHKPKQLGETTKNAFVEQEDLKIENTGQVQQTPTDGLQHYVDRGQPDFPHIGTPPTVEETVRENLEAESPAEVMSEAIARKAGLSEEKIEELRNQGLIRQTNP